MTKKRDVSWILNDEENITIETKDCNENILFGWDSIIAIKDLKVKWSSDIKRGDVFKKIRLTDDAGLIESGKMVLKTEFFKKK